MIEVDWNTFMVRYLPKKEIFVEEYDDRWELYTAHEIWRIRCTVEKHSDQAENMMFIERYFANKPGIVKVISMGKHSHKTEPFPEEMVDDIEIKEVNEDGDGQQSAAERTG